MRATPRNYGQAGKRLGPLLLRGLSRVALLALLWWALTGGDVDSWVIGAPAVLAAGVAGVALGPATGSRVRLLGLARFLPLFVWRSLLGGVDVALRALRPRLPISPSLQTYPLSLPPEGPARVFFAGVVNLLPGTLGAELHDRSLTVHVLSGGPLALVRLRELEGVVAALFGHELSPPAAGEA